MAADRRHSRRFLRRPARRRGHRAVAVAETDGPAAALAIVDGLDLGEYRYLHSTRAELLRRLGDREAARAAYDRALELTTTDAERRFLERRRAEP